MKNKILILTLALITFFASCQKDNSNGQDFPREEKVSLQASILSRLDMETKASFDHEGDGKGTFSNGDRISIYITPEGAPTLRRTATFNADTWTFDEGELNWGDIYSSKITFTAFYPPIDTPVDGEYTLTCETAQNFGGILERSDKLLVSSTTVSAGSPVVLNFRHAMHLLEIDLSSNDDKISSNALKMAEIKVNAYTEVGINPVTGEITKPRGPVKQIRMRNNNTEHFRAVICPQAILPEWKTAGWLTIKVNGDNIVYKVPTAYKDGTELNFLESGKRFRLGLTLGKNKEIIEDLTDKTIWVAGLQNIPSQTLWGIAYDNMGTLGLKYEPYYGWYDVKKLDATAPTYDDHRLCWAAACSNMLHWWYDRNKENVECYLRYKQATDPDYVAPLYNYDSNTHKASDIFDFFKRTCLDRGGWPVQGFRWYLRGDWITNSGDATSTEDNAESRRHRDQGGFFGEVYGDASLDEIWQGRQSGYDASEFIKSALKRGDALGIDHQSMSGNHAITLWGAAFDDNGEITTVYVCDNNHSDAELYQGGSVMIPGKIGPFGIFQMRIKRNSPSSLVYSLESSTKGTYGVYIAGLESLSLGKSAWDRFWAKHPDYAPKSFR